MPTDSPSWKDLIDMVADTVKTVDENAKRENDKVCREMTALRNDINILRTEMNASREDTFLSRTEMANLRTEMAELKGELKITDVTHDHEIQHIKEQTGMFDGTKAKIAAVVLTILGGIATIILKVLEYI